MGYEKNSVSGNNSGNSRNGSHPKKIQTEHGEAVISIPRDRNGQFEPIAVPKHESRGLSIEKLVISLYAKGMSVSDIEEEMRPWHVGRQIGKFFFLDGCPDRFKGPWSAGYTDLPVPIT